uniref:acid phosphatase n=1 Tax=Timema genevievae TaxID=629358 RepID=A0A7R9JPZ7_TIMGE|nr:unnamed protein product [Timema genevievae]
MEHFTLSTVLVVALLLSTGLVRSLPVDTGDDLGTIIFSSVLFRHGDRAPTGTYPNDIYNEEAKYWPRGYGQLSNIGEEQHFKQGSFFRKRYNHILPETYNVNDLYVRSSNIDRTLASARAHLAGLYPPTEQNLAQPNINFQVIPIHTTALVNDKVQYLRTKPIFLIFPTVYCEKYTTLLAYLEESDEYQCVMNTTSTVQNEVTELAGYSTFSSGIYDILFIEQLYNLSIPKWTSSYYPQPLRNLYLLETFISAAGTEELQRLSTGPLLKEIIANTQAKVNGTLSPDRGLYIYSAHDSNVVDLLQGLDVFNGILVPYASAVMIELRNKSDEYFITVSYKNSTETDPYLLQLPGCDALCPLDSFVELTKPIIPDDLTTECAEEVVAGQEYHFEIPAAGNIGPILL